jgi:hypothetical protein
MIGIFDALLSIETQSRFACQRYRLQRFSRKTALKRFDGISKGMKPFGPFPSESEDDMNHECMEIKPLMALYQTGQLSDEQRKHLNQHLLFCPDCVYQMVLAPVFVID